jgi:hypothetical protein
MNSGQDNKPKPAEVRAAARRARYHITCKPIQLAREKAARAVETAEQREARIRYGREYYRTNYDRIRARQKIARSYRRAEALQKYHCVDEAERAARRERWRKYDEEHRAERNAAARRGYARRAAKMTPEARAILHAQQKAYRLAHPEQMKATKARYLAKKKAVLTMTMTPER